MIPLVTFVGKHTIEYLLFSNIILFVINCIQSHGILAKFSFLQSLVIGMITIAFITFAVYFRNRLKSVTICNDSIKQE